MTAAALSLAQAAAGFDGESTAAGLFAPFEVPVALELSLVGVLGLCVGSFLGAAAYRLPNGLSLAKPVRSFCPGCKRTLTAAENVPVLSWLVQGGRCRGCKMRIPVRYPAMELCTGALFVLAAWLGRDLGPALVAVHALVLAALVLASAVDFERFEIPDEVSIGGMVLGPILSFALPALHDASPVAQALTDGWSPGLSVDRFGALVASLAGLVAGGGILLAIGWIGKRVYGRDAMGLGDVKLLAAGGAFVGAGGALAALVIGALVASIAGLVNVLRFTCFVRARARQRGGRRPLLRALAVGRIAGRYLPFGPYLGMGIGISLLAWDHVKTVLG